MRTVLLAILLLPLLTKEGVGGWSHQDDSIFAVRADSIKKLPPGSFTVADIGRLFLGTPYVAGTLDKDSAHENLVIDLHELDCVTFYENSLALWIDAKGSTFDGAHFHPPSATKDGFERCVEKLRYRNGVRTGYHSRLHYTTDYFYDNEKRGSMRNVTTSVAGHLWKSNNQPINFMTTHRSLYKQLASDAEYDSMLRVEKNIKARGSFKYIPKENVEAVEKNIQSGDILGITTNLPGLDCSHTGIAIRQPDGRIHFLNASSLKGKVIISEEPLSEYLTHSNHQTGIIVMRPQVHLR